MLDNHGIGSDELIILRTGQESTTVDSGSNIQEVRDYLESGLSPAEAVIPMVAPEHTDQLSIL